MVLASFCAAALSLPSSSFFRVEEIRVTGARSTPAAALAAAAEVPLGTRLNAVDSRAAADRLQALPAVRSARVRVSWPSTLEIDVVERRPAIALRVTHAAGAFLVLDGEAVPFRHADETGSLLPISVDGALLPWVRLGQPVPLRLVRETAEALHRLDAADRARVRAIRITARGDLDVALSSGASALVGSPRALADALPLAWQILQGLGPRAGAVATIDLRFGRNVVVRPAPLPSAPPAAPPGPPRPDSAPASTDKSSH